MLNSPATQELPTALLSLGDQAHPERRKSVMTVTVHMVKQLITICSQKNTCVLHLFHCILGHHEALSAPHFQVTPERGKRDVHKSISKWVYVGQSSYINVTTQCQVFTSNDET